MTLINVKLNEDQESSRNCINGNEIVLYFSENYQSIKELIASESSLLIVKGPRNVCVTAELNNNTLLQQGQNPGIILMENEYGEKIAIAYAYVILNDMGPNLNNLLKSNTIVAKVAATVPLRLDEDLACKVIDELEDWKSRQESEFMVNLKKREINHLAHLSIEWQKRRAELEQILSTKLDKCNLLTNALEEANQTIKV